MVRPLGGSASRDRSTLALLLAHPNIPDSMFVGPVSCDQKGTLIVEVSPSTTTSTLTVLGVSDRMWAIAFEGMSPLVGTKSQANVLRPGASRALQDSTGLALYVPSGDPCGCTMRARAAGEGMVEEHSASEQHGPKLGMKLVYDMRKKKKKKKKEQRARWIQIEARARRIEQPLALHLHLGECQPWSTGLVWPMMTSTLSQLPPWPAALTMSRPTRVALSTMRVAVPPPRGRAMVEFGWACHSASTDRGRSESTHAS